MNILIFAGSFYPFLGGYENFIYYLSKKLMQKGHSIDIFTMNTEKTKTFENIDGIRVYRIPCWNALNRTFPIPKPNLDFFRIFYLVYKSDYDLVNTHTRFFITSILGVIFSKIKRLPIVHVEHGSTHSIVKNKFVKYVNIVYDHLIGWYIIKSATNVGISKLACDFLRHIGDNSPNLILDGVDTDIFKKMDTGLKDKLNLDDNFIVVSVNRLIYAKGVQDIISIFPRLKVKMPGIKLLIVGDGIYKDELKKMIHDDYKDDILFLGTRTQREIVDILNIADIFVNSSYSEGFGITVLEAGAIGIPIIATKVGGVPELIDDYETGISIEPGDCEHLYKSIMELVEDSSLRLYIGNNIMTKIKNNYNWDLVATKYEQLFKRCINENRLLYYPLSV